MSKLVKELQIEHLRREFEGVKDLLVVDVIGIAAEDDNELRLDLRKKGISLQHVKNSLARKVLDEVGLPTSDSLFEGPSTVAWGGDGIVELAREISDWAKKLEKLTIKGGCVSGQAIDEAGVKQLSQMPSRPELLGQIIGMLLGAASSVVSQITGPASQIEKIAEQEGAATS